MQENTKKHVTLIYFLRKAKRLEQFFTTSAKKPSEENKNPFVTDRRFISEQRAVRSEKDGHNGLQKGNRERAEKS